MAANRIKGITIQIDGDVTGLNKALESTNKSLRNTQTALRDVNKLLKLDPKNTELLKQKQELLQKAVTDTKEKLDKEKEALRQLKEADQTPEVKEQQDALQREIIETEQKLKSAEDELKNFGSVGKQQMKAVSDEVKAVGGHIKDFGANVTKYVTTAIVGIGTASIAAFREVDKGYDNIIKKTGATGEALESMKDSLNNIVTTIPTDFETAGNAIGEVNTRFGLTGEELEQLSGQFIKFSKLNDTDITDSIDKVQKALAAYGLEGAAEAEAYLDRLNKTGQDTGISVDKLADGIINNATAFQEMGLGIDHATIFMGQLEKSGANVDTVLGGLKKALKKATEEGKPLSDALAELQWAVDNSDTSLEALNAAYELFGRNGADVARELQNGAIDFTNLAGAIDDVGGSVNETFANTQDPIDEFTKALNGAKLVGYDLGATLLTTLQPVLEKVSEIMKTLKEKWDQLDPSTQDMIVKAALIAAAIGPILMMVGTLVTVIGALISPIGLVVLAIGAAIAAGVLLYENWDKVKEAAKAFKDNLINDFNLFKDGFINIFTSIKDFFTETWDNIKQKTTEAWDNIKSKVEENGGGIKGIIKTAVEGYQELWENCFTKLDELTGGKLTDIYNWFNDKFTAIKDFVSGIVEDLKGIFDFEWSLPNLKLPHISWDWTDVGGLLSIPTFSVDWYKKAYETPYLFTTPTIMNGRGFGDGGGSGEIVYGRDQLMQDIAAASMGETVINVYATPGMNVNELADKVSDRLAQLQRQKEAVYA